MCEAALQEKAGIWGETLTLLWLLIGRIILLTHEKISFAILIGRIFFSHMKFIVRSSDWLELICVCDDIAKPRNQQNTSAACLVLFDKQDHPHPTIYLQSRTKVVGKVE